MPTSDASSDMFADDEVFLALRRIGRAIDLRSLALVQQAGLTGPQMLILKCLKRREPLSVGELAGAVNLSQATVTDILDRLAARGLVSRTRTAADRRRASVALTAAGMQKLALAPALMGEPFLGRFNALPEPDKTQIVSSLNRLVELLTPPDAPRSLRSERYRRERRGADRKGSK